MFDETASDASSEVEFRDFLRLLRRRKLLVMLTVLVLLCASVAYSHFQTPVYAAGASVVLQASSTESLFDPSTGFRNDPGRSLQTQIEVVKSEPVRAAVRQKLGAAPPVSVSPVGQTDIMRIVAESTSRTRAADIANAYANAYIDIRLKRAVDDQLAAAQQLQTKVDELQRQIDARSGAQKDQLIQAQGVIQQKLDQLQVGANLITGGAQVVSAASPPTAPTKPKPARNAVMAVLVGLVLGIALAFLVEYLDDSIKTQEDVHRLGRGMVVVGMIPTDPTWRAKSGARLVLVADPQSHVAEAYRSLRTSIQFRSLAHPVNVLQVTSANAQEGKTTTIANLAVSLARAGQRVVVMCCDLRRPRVHEFFGLPNDVGFTSVMLGEVPLSAALQPVPGIRGIMLLAPAGCLPILPSCWRRPARLKCSMHYGRSPTSS